MSNYHTNLKERQLAAESQRVKTILVFAESLKKRAPNAEVANALASVTLNLAFRRNSDRQMGRGRGRVEK